MLLIWLATVVIGTCITVGLGAQPNAPHVIYAHHTENTVVSDSHINACLDAHGSSRCNIANAFHACQHESVRGKACEVHLLPKSTHHIDGSLLCENDFLHLTTISNDVSIVGDDSTVKLSSHRCEHTTSSAQRRFLSILGSQDSRVKQTVSLRNIILSGFGSETQPGGSVFVAHYGALELMNVRIEHSIGLKGGAIYLGENVDFLGDGLHIHNAISVHSAGDLVYSEGYTHRFELRNSFIDLPSVGSSSPPSSSSSATSDGRLIHVGPSVDDITLDNVVMVAEMTTLVHFSSLFHFAGHGVSLSLRQLSLHIAPAAEAALTTTLPEETLLCSVSGGCGAFISVVETFQRVVIEDVVITDAVGGYGGLHIGRADEVEIHALELLNVGLNNTSNSTNNDNDNHYNTGPGLSIGNASVATLSDVVVQGYTSPLGAGIMIRNVSSASLLNVTVKHNSAALGGGGICSFGVDSLSITNCTVQENAAIIGAGLFTIQTNRVLLTNVLFESNSVGSNPLFGTGGGLYATMGQDLTVNRCTFLNNSGGFMGGGMAALLIPVTIEDSHFENNRAAFGGGLAVNGTTSATIAQSYFTKNAVYDSGGGVYVGHTQTVFLSELLAEYNTATRLAGGGMAIDSCAYVSLKQCNASNNEAASGGGIGIFFSKDGVYAVVEAHDLRLTQNTAVWGGGLALEMVESFIGNNVVISDGQATGFWGGGLYASGIQSSFTLQNSLVQNNTARLDGGGGYVVLTPSTTLRNVLVQDNAADSSTGNGGGWYFYSIDTVDLTEVAILHNSAKNGGGLQATAVNTMSFDHVDVSYNQGAEIGGGSYLWLVKTCYVTDVSWTQNTAGFYGGGVAMVGVNQSTIVSTNVTKNVAETGDGGGIYLRGWSTVDWRSLNASSNACVEGSGGGIGLAAKVVVADEDDAYATYAASKPSSFSLLDVTLLHNSAAVAGGGLSILVNAPFTLGNIVAVSNNASIGGGLHFAYVETAALVGPLRIEHNVARYGGGGISILDTMALWSCSAVGGDASSLCAQQYLHNEAPRGSALFLVDPSSFTRKELQHAYFGGNRASIGGTVYWVPKRTTWAAPVSFYNCTWRPDNVAPYGSQIGTHITSVVGPEAYDATPNDAVFSPSLFFQPFDYFHTFVHSESFALIPAITTYQCAQYLPSVSLLTTDGIFALHPLNGSLFAGMAMGCARQGKVRVKFTVAYDLPLVPESAVSSEQFSQAYNANISTTFAYRDCIRGEITGAGKCHRCGDASFTFHNDSTACRSCATMRGVRFCSGSTMALDEGYWRWDESTSGLVTCRTKAACIGGFDTGDALCRAGYTGPACSVCDDGYFRNNNACKACRPRSELTGGILMLILLAGLILFTLFLYVKRHHPHLQPLKPWLLYVYHSYPKLISKLKIILATFQIISNVPMVIQVTMPVVFVRYLSALEFFDLNLGFMFPFACSYRWNYFELLVVICLFPMALTLLFLGAYVLEANVIYAWLFPVHLAYQRYASPAIDSHETFLLAERQYQARQRALKNRYLNAWFYLTYLVLPTVTTSLFQVFNCTDIDPNQEHPGETTRFMTVDMTISCDSSLYRNWLGFVIPMIIVYPVGIPLVYFYALYTHRDEIQHREAIIDRFMRTLTAAQKKQTPEERVDGGTGDGNVGGGGGGIVAASSDDDGGDGNGDGDGDSGDAASSMSPPARSPEKRFEENLLQALLFDTPLGPSLGQLEEEQRRYRKAQLHRIDDKDRIRSAPPPAQRQQRQNGPPTTTTAANDAVDVEMGGIPVCDGGSDGGDDGSGSGVALQRMVSSSSSPVDTNAAAAAAAAAAVSSSTAADGGGGDHPTVISHERLPLDATGSSEHGSEASSVSASAAAATRPTSVPPVSPTSNAVFFGHQKLPTASSPSPSSPFSDEWLSSHHHGLSPEVLGISFLWSAYDPAFWFWEIIETTRRIVLTAVLSILAPGTSLQTILSILLAIFYLQLYSVCTPYDDAEDDALANIGQVQVFLTFFVALILRNGLLHEEWDSLLGILLIVINTLLYFLPVYFFGRRLVDAYCALVQRQLQQRRRAQKRQLQSQPSDAAVFASAPPTVAELIPMDEKDCVDPPAKEVPHGDDGSHEDRGESKA